MKTRTPKYWRIYDPGSDSYYAGPTGIGPRFGARREAAMLFADAASAVGVMGHWAFSGCRLELPDGTLQSEVPHAGQAMGLTREDAERSWLAAFDLAQLRPHWPKPDRADLRDARCVECGARCVPGQTHLEHNAGWKKKLLMWDWYDVELDGYPGWDLVDPGGGHQRHPPFIKLAIKNKTDKSSGDISREFDDIAVGRFYSRDWSREGSPFVREGEVYDAGWWFQKREDAYTFIKLYGGVANG